MTVKRGSNAWLCLLSEQLTLLPHLAKLAVSNQGMLFKNPKPAFWFLLKSVGFPFGFAFDPRARLVSLQLSLLEHDPRSTRHTLAKHGKSQPESDEGFAFYASPVASCLAKALNECHQK